MTAEETGKKITVPNGAKVEFAATPAENFVLSADNTPDIPEMNEDLEVRTERLGDFKLAGIENAGVLCGIGYPAESAVLGSQVNSVVSR